MRTTASLLGLTLFATACGHGALAPLGPNEPSSRQTSIAPQSSSYAVLYRFKGGKDGYEPQATLAVDKSGNMYGTTTQGGNAQNDGTVFKITPSGKKTTLYVFKGGNDGASPIGGLIVDSKGDLFGTTSGGANALCTGGCGTVFELKKMAARYKEKVLYRFGAAPDASVPYGTLIVHNGTLFGTTVDGGGGNGTVFKLAPAGSGYKETVVWRFKGGPDGAQPYSGLTFVNGAFYGTTAEGGNSNHGTIFSISKSGKEKVVYAFADAGTDSFAPHDVPLALGGALYGTAASGGTQDAGTVFRYESGRETILYAFEDNSVSDGQIPTATPVAIGGTFYGTTEDGGGTNYGYGTVYKLAPVGGGIYKEALLHAFGATATDGLSVTAGLTPYKGSFYGVTRFGGGTPCSQGCGTFFKIKP